MFHHYNLKKLQEDDKYKIVFSSFPIEYKENYISYYYRLKGYVVRYKNNNNYLLNTIIKPGIELLYILNNMKLKYSDFVNCSKYTSINNINKIDVNNMLIKIHRKAYNKYVLHFNMPIEIEDYIFKFLY